MEITKTSLWTKSDGVNGDHMKGDKDNGEKCDNVNGHNGRKYNPGKKTQHIQRARNSVTNKK